MNKEKGNYTGINRFLKSDSLQKLFNMKREGTFKYFLEDWKWIFSFSGKYKGIIVFYVLIGIISSSFSLAASYTSSAMINIVVEKQYEKIWLLVLIFVASTVLSIVLDSVTSRIGTKISIYVNNDIQKNIFEKIMDADWLEMSRYSDGDLVNRFANDVRTIANNAIHWIPNLIVNLYSFGLTFFVIFAMDKTMALIAVVSAPFLVLMSRYILRRMSEYKKNVLDMNSKMMSFEVETFYNIDMIKSFGVTRHSTNKLEEWQNKYKDLNLDYNKFEIRAGIWTKLLSAAVTAVAFAYCLFRLWSGQILFGDMTFFLSRRAALTAKFKTLVATVPDMITSAVSAHRIKELVDLPREKHDAKSFEKIKETAESGLTLKMEDVFFSYEEGNNIYEHGSFEAKPNEIIAVLGPSGEGKTTMLRLFLGLIRPEQGSVYLESKEGIKYPMNADLRPMFSYVPQGNTVFSGTVAENLRMVKENATDEEIIDALKLSMAWDFVSKSPEGINMRVGEKGRGLSEGQAQRIAIARAILNDAPILLLDEATSALDEETEKQVLNNIVKQRPNKTCIVSTHRKSVLRLCHRVYIINDGHTEEQSNMEDFLKDMDL